MPLPRCFALLPRPPDASPAQDSCPYCANAIPSRVGSQHGRLIAIRRGRARVVRGRHCVLLCLVDEVRLTRPISSSQQMLIRDCRPAAIL
ncbi:hypothetical protein CMEL01_00573 [Colletotrichum melonis]|uniref:Uncharacterized protein n=1 Tax=Colletotrichum melonis TaxID=1209925 RepID=A0AAI9XYH9_9PEZI|nr:hypothetical protein CMEL01_00573 [Colletotrichum melonis]